MMLVTGATGKVGGEAARLLASHGVPIRAFVRNESKAAQLSEAGAELALGDFDDTASIDAALVGVDTVILVSPGLPGQESNVVAAAQRAGVSHITYLTSKASEDSPIERRRWKAQTEQALADSGIPHTLLKSNAYMQNTLGLAPLIAATSTFESSSAEGRVGFVDTRDVAEVAATIATTPAAHAGKTYHLTGPQSLSFAEVAAILTDLLGHPVTFRTISAEEEREKMISRGLPEPVATMNAQASALGATGDADWASEDIETLIGRKPHSYRDFAQDHLDAFRA